MPILPLEPFAYPPDPFAPPGLDTPEERAGDGEWLVLHTKSRAEKALARWLLSASIRFFLPLYKKQSVGSGTGRAQTAHAPLFPGYVFLWGNADARYHALASNQVAQCLPVHDQNGLETDLAAVYRLMTGVLPLAPAQQIPAGSPVEVIDGPFAGMTGRMIRAGAQTRLFVEVRMINQGVSVELERSAVRPLTENGRAERARIALLRC
jgi:transcription antitermination factor NusG